MACVGVAASAAVVFHVGPAARGHGAGLAGISQRHLSFLEPGRSAPSRDMVVRLAATLDLPLRQQNALLAAAGYARPHASRNRATRSSRRRSSTSWLLVITSTRMMPP